jgi:hypothetical protein
MKFPRSKGAPAVVIAGSVWDDVAEVLEWCQGLSVSAPLMMYDTPGGPVIALRGAEPGDIALLKLTSVAGGGGKYLVSEYTSGPSVDVSSGTNLSEADFGTATGSHLLLNSTEVGQSTHDLTAGSNLPQNFIGIHRYTNTDGTKIFATPGFQVESCPASGAPSPGDGGAGASYALIGI